MYANKKNIQLDTDHYALVEIMVQSQGIIGTLLLWTIALTDGHYIFLLYHEFYARTGIG